MRINRFRKKPPQWEKISPLVAASRNEPVMESVAHNPPLDVPNDFHSGTSRRETHFNRALISHRTHASQCDLQGLPCSGCSMRPQTMVVHSNSGPSTLFQCLHGREQRNRSRTPPSPSHSTLQLSPMWQLGLSFMVRADEWRREPTNGLQ
jgi:hypothetical protein